MGAGPSQPTLSRRHTLGNEIELGQLDLGTADLTYPLREYRSFQPPNSYLLDSSSDHGHLIDSGLHSSSFRGSDSHSHSPLSTTNSSFSSNLARARGDHSIAAAALAEASPADTPTSSKASLRRNSTGSPPLGKRAKQRPPGAGLQPEHAAGGSDSALTRLDRSPGSDVGHLSRRSHLKAGSQRTIASELVPETSDPFSPTADAADPAAHIAAGQRPVSEQGDSSLVPAKRSSSAKGQQQPGSLATDAGVNDLPSAGNWSPAHCATGTADSNTVHLTSSAAPASGQSDVLDREPAEADCRAEAHADADTSTAEPQPVAAEQAADSSAIRSDPALKAKAGHSESPPTSPQIPSASQPAAVHLSAASSLGSDAAEQPGTPPRCDLRPSPPALPHSQTSDAHSQASQPLAASHSMSSQPSEAGPQSMSSQPATVALRHVHRAAPPPLQSPTRAFSAAVAEVQGPGADDQSLSAAEVSFYSQLIHSWLPVALPSVEGQSAEQAVVDACRDGILLSHLLNAAAPDSIDARAINQPAAGSPLPGRQAAENATLFLNAAKALGCTLAHVTPSDITSGQETSVLDCVWQTLKLGLLKDVNVKHTPQLVLIRSAGEEASQMVDLPSEQLLLRWLNYHLRDAPAWQSREAATSFSRDLQDGAAMAGLLSALAPNSALPCSAQEDLHERWSHLGHAAQRLTSTPLPPAELLAKGNARMHCAALALLFSACPGLEAASRAAQDQLAHFVAWLEEYEVEDSREERTFCVWITSLLNCPFRAGLFDGLRDGYALLRVIDSLSPGAVDWRAVRKPPFKPLLRRVHSIENCNQAVAAVRSLLQVPLVNIGGQDIADRQRKLVLAVLWLLMRFHIRSLLSGVASQGLAISDAQLDAEVLHWANHKVAESGRERLLIRSFGDRSLASGLFLGHLLAAVQPAAMDVGLLTPGDTPRDCELNAKYVISCTRKLGCFLFLVWEDILEVNQRMILVLIASIMALDAKLRNA